MSRLLVLCAHPELRHSRVNAALLRSARALEAADPARIGVRDLYALYPDYTIDVAAEQREVEAAELIVWLHPIHWYAMPALMKLWVDEVLAHGWAYGHGSTALHGKRLWLVASTGGPAHTYGPAGYNRHPFEAYLLPYQQTAALCGLQWQPPLLLHGAHAAGDDEIAAQAARFRERLQAYPDWCTTAADAAAGAQDAEVPDRDRPAHAA